MDALNKPDQIVGSGKETVGFKQMVNLSTDIFDESENHLDVSFDNKTRSSGTCGLSRPV